MVKYMDPKSSKTRFLWFRLGFKCRTEPFQGLQIQHYLGENAAQFQAQAYKELLPADMTVDDPKIHKPNSLNVI